MQEKQERLMFLAEKLKKLEGYSPQSRRIKLCTEETKNEIAQLKEELKHGSQEETPGL